MFTPPIHRNKSSYDRRNHKQPRNPFANITNNHDNFPGIDDAFDFTKKESPDCSSMVSPSELDMSIGERAALAQDTWRVNNYGLDSVATPMKTIDKRKLNTMDDQWDQLMDGTNLSFTSLSTSFLSEHNQSKSYTPSYARTNISSLHENEPLDMTFDQSDFFNSSRVGALATPEKNKQKVDEASRLARLGFGVPQYRRGIPNYQYNESVSGSTDYSEQSGMVGLFNAALRIADEVGDDSVEIIHESFVSYNEPDLSTMSNGMLKLSDEKFSNHFSPCEESFISFREPDLSLISNRQTPYGDVSATDHSLYFQDALIHKDSQCLSPKRGDSHSDFQLELDDFNVPSELNWPENSIDEKDILPPLPVSDDSARSNSQRNNPPINTSIDQRDMSKTEESFQPYPPQFNCVPNDDIHVQWPSASPEKESPRSNLTYSPMVQVVMNKTPQLYHSLQEKSYTSTQEKNSFSNTSSQNSKCNKSNLEYSSFYNEIDIRDRPLVDSRSTLTASVSNDDVRNNSSVSSGSTNTLDNSSVSHRSRLRERYLRPDRFEDDYIVKSDLSDSRISSQEDVDIASTSRSLFNSSRSQSSNHSTVW